MADTTHARTQASLRRDAILEALAFAAERLLLTPDWRDAAMEVLARMGTAAEVSRAYVVRNDLDDEGRVHSVWIAEWTEPGFPRVSDDPEFRRAPWAESGFGRWAETLRSGDAVKGAVVDLPGDERAVLERHGVVSLASFPIFVDGDWWGSIGFDDGRQERDWVGPELDALRATANLLGAAIHRRRAEGQALEAESRYREVIEHIPAVTYTDLPGKDGAVVGFMSHQIESLLGYPRERFHGDPDFWFSLIHRDDHDRIDEAARLAGRTQGRFDAEYRMTAADGGEVWVHDISEPILDAEGSIRYWQGFLTDVTERRRAEDLVRDAERRFRDLVEQLPAVLYIEEVEPGTSRPVRVSYMSPKVEDLLGYRPERWLETTDLYLEIIHPDDLVDTLAKVERSAEEGVPLDVDYRMRHADGRWVWVHEEAALIRDADGNPVIWQGVMVDITEQKQAEAALREAEERFRAIVEQNPAVIYTQEIDPDTGTSYTTYISPRDEELTGHTHEEVMRDPDLWAKIIHPDDRARVLAADRESNEVGGTFSMEFRIIAKDGRVLWVRDEATLVQVGDAAPFWQGYMIDITDRKRGEEALRESHEHVRQIVDTALDALVTMDSGGRINGWNPQAEATFGWPRDDVLGRSLADTIIPERHRQAHREGLLRYAETGAGPVLNRRIEITALHRDGREFPVELSIVPVQVGGDTTFSAFVRDISERKRVQEELERALELERDATQQLRALDEMKNTFLQAVSHDLRTPLAAILGLAVTLERGDVELEPGDARDLARRIADNARKLDRLVTNLLDMDRLARGIVTPKLLATDVGALVRRLLAESELIAGSRMHMDIQPVTIGVDPAKVERIVENLLANTVRHTPSNAQIWVSVRPQDGGALLLVEDDGPGVPAELRETVFEPFQQGPEAPQHSPGVGVGLTLVKRFAELHGGRAWVEERTGGGASFRVFLPDAGDHPRTRTPQAQPEDR